MKQFTLISTIIFTLLFTSSNLFAQSGVTKGANHYKLSTAWLLQECDAAGSIGSLPITLAPSKAKFSIIGNDGSGNHIIHFWDWTVPPAKNVKQIASLVAAGTSPTPVPGSKLDHYYSLNYTPTATPKTRYFLLPEDKLDDLAKELTSLFEPTGGTAVLPFKMRRGVDFTPDISLAGMGGIKCNVLPESDLAVNGLLGIGLAMVNLNADNTNQVVPEAESRAAFSFHGGLVLEWKQLQIGLFLGGDWLPKGQVDCWENQGKPWIGFGIGAALFSRDIGRKEGKNRQ